MPNCARRWERSRSSLSAYSSRAIIQRPFGPSFGPSSISYSSVGSPEEYWILSIAPGRTYRGSGISHVQRSTVFSGLGAKKSRIASSRDLLMPCSSRSAACFLACTNASWSSRSIAARRCSGSKAVSFRFIAHTATSRFSCSLYVIGLNFFTVSAARRLIFLSRPTALPS